jgi:threonine synthase
MMGLPIKQLVLATNENNVLDEFFRTGVYRVRKSSETFHTSSPSMDISKASNFERFMFDLLGRDANRTRELFGQQLSGTGQFDLSADPAFAQISRYGFVSGASTHNDRLNTMRDAYFNHGEMIDTHTADGVTVARRFKESDVPMIVLETALPIKFADTVQEALGRKPLRPAGYDDIELMPQRFVEIEADAARVKQYIVEHSVA